MAVKSVLLLSFAFYLADASPECLASASATSLLQIGRHSVVATPLDFDSYVTQFQREYTPNSDEYNTRHANFQGHGHGIHAQNAKPQRLWSAGFNHFADRSHSELASLRGWRRMASSRGDAGPGLSLLAERSQVMKQEVDWRSLHMASKVPDQGSCGSCWAVATSAMLEARYEIQKKQNRTFSAQQLVNCVPNPKECGGKGGCEGATVELALTYVQENGLKESTDEGVPYLGQDRTCLQPLSPASLASFDSTALTSSQTAGNNKHGIGMQYWHTLPPNQAAPLMMALADGPVAIAAAADAWTFYTNGVFDSCDKDAVIDHAIVMWGYGKDEKKGVKYWLVRNSWGPVWGEQGYIRLLRQDTPDKEDGHCGIDKDPSMGIACKPYPKEQTVCGQCGLLFDSVAVQFA